MDVKKPKHSLTMDKPPSTPHVPLEKSKVDSNSTQATRKISGDKGTGSKSLGKLSKSQDNLASQLRRKAVAEALHKKDSGNKENINFREKSASPGPKSKSRSTGIPVRKSHSAHSIEKSATPIKRAQSVQNIEHSSNSATATNTKTGSTVKKAQSAHNVSTEPGQVRLSTHSQNIMAYSAELLASFEKEKKILEERISKLIQQAECRKTELERCKFEIKNLKERVHSEEEVEMIRSENRLLKDRLNELGVSVEHITDSEKLLRQQRLAESSPDEARGATGRGESVDSIGGSDLGHSLDFSSCVTPEHASSLSFDNCNWDKQSNKSSDALSEISMACLQDRIVQMEENHYSTSEELQATLQELSDLQDAVNELTGSNEQLGDEKMVLLESLCTQTEKLENCRMQIEHLKVLLVSDNEKDRSENERQLVLLIKSAQEEREELLLKQAEMMNCISSLGNETREQQDVINALRDKSRILEMKNESLLSDKRAMDTQIIEVKQQESKAQIEIQKQKTLVENEKTKVTELEQFRNATDKSDLEELLDNARQEKDKIEQKLTDAQQKCAISQSTLARMTERINSLEEDMKVCKNNAKTEISDVMYKLESTKKKKVPTATLR